MMKEALPMKKAKKLEVEFSPSSENRK